MRLKYTKEQFNNIAENSINDSYAIISSFIGKKQALCDNFDFRIIKRNIAQNLANEGFNPYIPHFGIILSMIERKIDKGFDKIDIKRSEKNLIVLELQIFPKEKKKVKEKEYSERCICYIALTYKKRKGEYIVYKSNNMAFYFLLNFTLFRLKHRKDPFKEDLFTLFSRCFFTLRSGKMANIFHKKEIWWLRLMLFVIILFITSLITLFYELGLWQNNQGTVL